MDTTLEISSEVYQVIPGLVVISGFLEPGTPDREGISSYLRESWVKLADEVERHGLFTHPRIAPWVEALEGAGVPVKKFPLSILAMGKRASKIRDPFSINPIVDTYNAISMDLLVPGGAYDLSQMDGGLGLRLSMGGEEFLPIGNGKLSHTVSGEIVYSDEVSVLTRMFLWQQSDKAKVSDSSRRLVFVFELLDTLGGDLVTETCAVIEEKFSTLLGGKVHGLSVQRLN